MQLSDCRVTIVGLGLMGGSLGLALMGEQACQEVTGVARRGETLRRAVEWGAIQWGTLDLVEGVKDADLVILATPVRTIIDLLGRISPHLKEGAVVMDLGSTKAAVARAMAVLPSRLQPVGGHPMCGRERAGIEAAEPDLYRGATFVLTPLERTSGEALSLAQDLVEAVGARPLILDPETHDGLVATTSHLPYLLAVALMGTLGEIGAKDERVYRLAAGGFRDTSRLASSEVTMMLDILLTNRSQICQKADLFCRSLTHLLSALQKEDEEILQQILIRAQRRREEMVLL